MSTNLQISWKFEKQNTDAYFTVIPREKRDDEVDFTETCS